MKRAVKALSIVSYLLIILKGQMIGIPFGLWLIAGAFAFGSIDQLFAVMAIIGLALIFSKWKEHTQVIVVSFLLMLSPIVTRMVQVPIEMFDYLAFEIPLATFVLTYIILIVLHVVERMRTTPHMRHRSLLFIFM